jgi:hypothetical protein
MVDLLNSRMPDTQPNQFLQRFSSTTVWQRMSPANTHIMKCWLTLDWFSGECLCRQQDLAQLVTLLVAQRLDVDLVLGLHF